MMNLKVVTAVSLAMLVAACGGEKRQKTVAVEDKSPEKQVVASQEVCQPTNTKEIAALFDRWNEALKSGKPENVVALYAKDSILLPTVSNQARYTPAQKEDYFHHFMEKKPSGQINERYIQIGCDSAFDAGIYTFTFAKTGESVVGRYSYTYKWDGKQWLISSHHSSAMPEKADTADKADKDKKEEKSEKSESSTHSEHKAPVSEKIASEPAKPVEAQEAKPEVENVVESVILPEAVAPEKAKEATAQNAQPIVIYLSPNEMAKPQVIHILPQKPENNEVATEIKVH